MFSLQQYFIQSACECKQDPLLLKSDKIIQYFLNLVKLALYERFLFRHVGLNRWSFCVIFNRQSKRRNAMFCPNCGTQLDDNAKFCSKCGAKTGAEGAQEAPRPTQPQTPQAQYGYKQYDQNEIKPSVSIIPFQDFFTHNIIITILSVFCCVCPGLITSIVGLVFSSKARTAASLGDIVNAQSSSNTAKTMFYISLVLIIISFIISIIYVAVVGLGGILAMMESL
jgi:hypothetical protein